MALEKYFNRRLVNMIFSIPADNKLKISRFEPQSEGRSVKIFFNSNNNIKAPSVFELIFFKRHLNVNSFSNIFSEAKKITINNTNADVFKKKIF